MRAKFLVLFIAGLILFPAIISYAGGIQEAESDSASQVKDQKLENIPESITVIDSFGREVTIKLPVKTVASGLSVATQILKILNTEDKMVAIDGVTVNQPFLYGELCELPVTWASETNWYDLDFEKILELCPDLFITGVQPMQDGFDKLIKTLEPQVPCIALSLDTPEQIYEGVELLGKILGKQERAREYIDFCQTPIDMILERTANIPEDKKTTIYYELGMPYFTFNRDFVTFQTQIDIAGGVNIAADSAAPYGSVDPEWIIEKDPDVIVVWASSAEGVGGMKKVCGYDIDDDAALKGLNDSIRLRPELAAVDAVINERLYTIDMVLSITSSIGQMYMAKWLYPELFEDLDPQAFHQEYLSRFLGIDYDLSKHGVFVYPKS